MTDISVVCYLKRAGNNFIISAGNTAPAIPPSTPRPQPDPHQDHSINSMYMSRAPSNILQFGEDEY